MMGNRSNILAVALAGGAVVLQAVYPGFAVGRIGGIFGALAIGAALALVAALVPGLATTELARAKMLRFAALCLGLGVATFGLDRLLDVGYMNAMVASLAANLAIVASTMYVAESLTRRRPFQEGN